MIFVMINELEGMNKRHVEDREKFRTFSKKYGIDCEE